MLSVMKVMRMKKILSLLLFFVLLFSNAFSYCVYALGEDVDIFICDDEDEVLGEDEFSDEDDSFDVEEDDDFLV